MRQLVALVALILLILTYGISLSLRDPAVIPESFDAVNHPGFYDYRGALNVQSELSTGFLPATKIIQTAQDKKVDFIIFNELNRFLPGGVTEGWQRQTLVLSGGKYGYLDANLLSLAPERLSAAESLGQAQTVIADLLSNVGSNAKPRESISDVLILSRDSLSSGVSGNSPALGVEVVNVHQWLTQFANNDRLSFLWSALIFPFNPDLAILRSFADFDTSFSDWDRRSAAQPTFGILGLDAGSPFPVFGFGAALPSYDALFRAASTHILLRSELTGEFASDRRKVLRALYAGQSYFAIDSLGPTKGFAAWADDGGTVRPLGTRFRLAESARILVRLPRKPDVAFETVILRDGASIMTSNSTETEFRVHQPGVYRIVVRLFTSLSVLDGGRWLPWIMTNPIVITPRS